MNGNERKLMPENHIISSAKDEVLIENKQKQIVQGALGLFFTKGFHPTTIREIAHSCGMSMGQLYHYISSKDDVLYLVHKEFHKLQNDLIEAQDLEECKDPLQKLISCLKANLNFVNENKELIKFILTETKYLEKGCLEIVLDMEKRFTIEYYQHLLEEVNKQTPIKGDIKILASIIAYIPPFLPMRGWAVKDKSVDEINSYLLNFIIKGLGLPMPE
jgi:AcrR family transcriptional regulator